MYYLFHVANWLLLVMEMEKYENLPEIFGQHIFIINSDKC